MYLHVLHFRIHEINRIRDDGSLIEFIGSGDVAFNNKLVHSYIIYHVVRYVNVLSKSHLKWGECYFSVSFCRISKKCNVCNFH